MSTPSFILLIDVDDTLVLWEHPSDYSSPYNLNEPLIKLINWCVANTAGFITIWSGGGEQYSEKWSNQIFGTVLGKNRIPAAAKASIKAVKQSFNNIPLYIVDDDESFLSNGKGLEGVYVFTPDDLAFLDKLLRSKHLETARSN